MPGYAGDVDLNKIPLTIADAQILLAADCLAGTAFEEDIVGNNDRGATVRLRTDSSHGELLQDCEDVLEEVEL